ncbi:MAG: TrmH family RNA methyltransferase [Flavobacteriia bacterium]|jgi:tRNA (guanosine-2'-O-)-methyltransferase
MKKEVLEEFYKIITPNKQEMFDRIAAQRTKHITVVLENVFQEHNASAVLRSCDCFGIQELHVIEKDNQYKVQRDIALGAGRWVDMYNFDKGSEVTKDCLTKLKSKGYKIVATSPHTEKTINDIDLSQPMAFVFGTERRGISDEVVELSDELVKIPMYGFTESFNISVSVALVLNTIRTRLEESDLNWKLSQEDLIDLKIKWCKKILNGGEALEKHFIQKLKEN